MQMSKGRLTISLEDDDELIEVKFTDNKKDIILVTKYGQCIRFKDTDVQKHRKSIHGCSWYQP